MSDKFQTVIFLIRHGQTDRVYSSDPDTDNQRVLSRKGIGQLKKVGEYLKAFAPEKIYASPRKRTLQSAELIRQEAGVEEPVEEAKELFEIYSDADYRSLEARIPRFFSQIVGRYPGKQIVCVSHQDVIQGGLNAFQLTEAEKDFPCQMADVYRLVFAGAVLVECQKLRPADAVQA